MEFLNVLTRSEMKNVKGGTPQSACDYDGCEGSSEVFLCWYGECWVYYSGQEAIDCVNSVGSSQQLAIAMCGPGNYS